MSDLNDYLLLYATGNNKFNIFIIKIEKNSKNTIG